MESMVLLRLLNGSDIGREAALAVVPGIRCWLALLGLNHARTLLGVLARRLARNCCCGGCLGTL